MRQALRVIVVVEGPSAAGKTTWCEKHASRWLPEPGRWPMEEIYLDLLAEVEDRAGPIPGCLVVAARTVDGLLDTQRPPCWDELTYLKKATGRQPLEADERERLGERASCVPVFG